MSNWVIGRNMAGYLPESGPFITEDWEQAAHALAEDMREYADTDDDLAYEWLMDTADRADYPDFENEGFGDDEPSMLATVQSILRDDPPEHGMEWAAQIEDNNGVVWEFWLHSTDEPVSEDSED